MTVNAFKKIISRYSESDGNGLERKKQSKNPSSGRALPSGEKEAINIESLRQLIPVRSLSDDELTAFSIGRYAEKIKQSVTLFTENEQVDSVFYLLSGTVRIESKGGRGYEISAGSAQSRFPLSTGITHTTTAKTTTPVTVLRVSSDVMAISQENIDSEIMSDIVDLRVIPPELDDSQLFQAIYQNYTQEDLALSILPSVADMVKRAMSRKINESQAARLIETDAVIAAKVISVANSPLFNRAGSVYTALDAVRVLGLKATQNLVKNACDRYVLTSSNRPYVEQVQQSSAQSLLVSGLCYALASLTETVDPKQALIAGLLSDVGIMPFSHYVDKFPNKLYSQDEIDTGWPIVRGFMGSYVLEKLGMPDQLSGIPALSEDWMYDSGKTLDLADIVILSRLQVQMDDFVAVNLPPLESIPAVQKLGGNGLTAELTRMLNQMAMKRIKMPLALVKQPLTLPKQVVNN